VNPPALPLQSLAAVCYHIRKTRELRKPTEEQEVQVRKERKPGQIVLTIIFLLGLNLGVFVGWVAAQVFPHDILVLDSS
jgi:hypothetical protein